MPSLLPPTTGSDSDTDGVLIKEHDEACSKAVWLGTELAVEWEAKRAIEARAKKFWQKVIEVEEAHQMANGMVMELRGSLGLLETMRQATHFELCDTR